MYRGGKKYSQSSGGGPAQQPRLTPPVPKMATKTPETKKGQHWSQYETSLMLDAIAEVKP
jgi:hypothetical protein